MFVLVIVSMWGCSTPEAERRAIVKVEVERPTVRSLRFGTGLEFVDRPGLRRSMTAGPTRLYDEIERRK